MRLFIASPVRLYDYTELKSAFSSILNGKWVEEENLHLTWIFLGERASIPAIKERMELLAPLTESIPLCGIEYFGNPPRILFAGGHEKALYKKAKEFRGSGFDLYRFKPHVTLCRIKMIHDYKRFKALKKSYKDKKLGEILPEITLYESVLTKERAYYKKIESVTK